MSASFPVVNTGIYFGPALKSFGLQADFDLGVMRPGQSLSRLTSRILLKMESYFASQQPQLVLGHGDTTTCFAAAVSSFYHRIPFFHVEAGLRSGCLDSPFPEEFNRQSVASLATHHFANTDLERQHLLKDGIAPQAITVTGTTVHDAVQMMRQKDLPSAFQDVGQPVVTVTVHRRENASALGRLVEGFRGAAIERPDAIFLFPLHPNPHVREILREGLQGLQNIVLMEPLEYPRFVSLLCRSNLVVTDSGGVQEEAAFLGAPVLLVREVTERADGLASGLVQLVGTDPARVRESILRQLARPFVVRGTRSPENRRPAAEMIADRVAEVGAK